MIDLKDLVVGHYYGGTSPKGNIAQWDGEDFIVSLPPVIGEDAETTIPEWQHYGFAHPQQFVDCVFVPMIDLTVLVNKEFFDG